MPNQYTIDTATLKELQDWKAWRDSQNPNDPKNFNDPTFAAKYNGDQLSPAAQQYAVGRVDPTTGKPANGVNGQHFDTSTGQIEKNKGFWQTPESYGILAAAGGLAAPYIVPALAGIGGGGGVPGSSAQIAAMGGEDASTGVAGAVAPAVKTATTSGISSWLTSPTASLINGVAGAAGNIFGTIKQANASKEAEAFQEKQFEEALQAQKEQAGYDRNQYAAYLGRLQGYSDTGNAANGRLAAFMGQGNMPTNTTGSPLHPSATPPPAMPPSTPGGPPPAPFTPPPQGAPLPGGQPQGQTVKMVGPDGSMRDIPADQVQKYLALGAKPAPQAGA